MEASKNKNHYITEQGLLVDFSKHSFFERKEDFSLSDDQETVIKAGIEDLFKGAILNKSENRQVLHPLLRASNLDSVEPDLQEKWLTFQSHLDEMAVWSQKIKDHEFLGATGKPIKQIVHIGIGGSDLGPKLVYDYFSAFKESDLEIHFVSNIDPLDWHLLRRKIDLEQTLFVVVSKSFSTLETAENAKIAKHLLKESQIGDAWAHHFIAISSNTEKAKEFGINPSHILPLDEAIGGRFSVWSTVSLSLVLGFGIDMFKEFLLGAEAMDRHFKTQPLSQNIPVMMAVLDDYYRNTENIPALSVMPYSSLLRHLCGYLQQLSMESNGKSVTIDNKPATKKTGPIIFGQIGTDAQHMYAQWLHQGTDIIPTDFIGFKESLAEYGDHQALLLSNMQAQAEALYIGEENKDEPYRHFSGGRPSTTLLFDKVSVFNLGMLLACYEHRIYAQSLLWHINAFDQWGVELGKKVARRIYEKNNN